MMGTEIGKVGFAFADYIAMAGYFMLVIGIGLFFAWREKSEKSETSTEDYFLGGRKIPTLIIAVSMFVTLFSAISFVAVPAEAFQHGLSLYLPLLLAPIGTIIGFFVFVRFYFTQKSFTPFEYLERRYNRWVRLFISAVFLVMRLLYLGVVMYASAKAFKGAAGWPIYSTILAVGLVAMFYTTLGGIKAVVWMDFLQFLILVVGIGYVLVVLGGKVDGGWSEILNYSFANGHGFEAEKDLSAFFSFNPYERFTFWLLIVGMISLYTFTYGADQLVIQRLLSTPSYKHALKATIINQIISLPVASIFWMIGLGLFVFYTKGAVGALPEGIHPGEVFSYFITTQLPSPVPGLLMVALLAAVFSTVDSGMNSLSAVFVKDIYKPFIKPDATVDKEMKVAKIMTGVWGGVFICFALGISFLSESVSSSVMEIAGIWGSLLGLAAGAFLLGVTSKRAHSGVVFVSAIVGLLGFIFFVWKFYYGCPPDERISFSITASVPFFAMVFVGYPLSFIWPRKKGSKSIEGLTLSTYKKEPIKNEAVV